METVKLAVALLYTAVPSININIYSIDIVRFFRSYRVHKSKV